MKGIKISEIEFEEPVQCTNETTIRCEIKDGKTEVFVSEDGIERQIKIK